jgi:hypothetical protein
MPTLVALTHATHTPLLFFLEITKVSIEYLMLWLWTILKKIVIFSTKKFGKILFFY